MSGRNFEPTHEVTMYQARCTNCGYIETEYGDYNAWSDDGPPVEMVTDSGWFNSLGNRYEGGVLLCEKCQKCEVCDNANSYEKDGHLVCDDHEDHKFEVATDA